MSKGVFYIPSGPKNLASLFPGIDWSLVTEYCVVGKDSGSNILFVSPVFKANCCCPDDGIRIHFMNSLGTFDAINFMTPQIEHDDTADSFENALNYPLQKTDTGVERFNVKGNDTYTVRVNLIEGDQVWIRELADSPKMYIEWTGIEGQADDYLPVVKISDKFLSLKNDGSEFSYQYVMQFKLSNDYTTIRN